MNEVTGHFIYREISIGCCTELLEYTEIVMAILYCYICKWPFMNEVPGHFIYWALAIGCCTMCCIKTWKVILQFYFFTMLSLLKLSQLLLGIQKSEIYWFYNYFVQFFWRSGYRPFYSGILVYHHILLDPIPALVQ